MTKFFDEDMNEVDAFTKEEVEAQIEKTVQSKIAEAKKELEKSLSEKEVELSALNTKLDKRGEEYTNAKNRIKELEAISNDGTQTVAEAKTKFRDGLINKLAGEDKEYKEALKAQAERLGFNTLDVTEAEKNLKEAHSLAQLALNREASAFSMASVSIGGREPDTSRNNTNADKASDAQVAAVVEAMGGGTVKAGGGMEL